ncbi:hypothetical protein [Cloacibacterium normanense]
MIDFIFGFFRLFIRLAFVYKFDLKKMNANNSPEESHINTIAGLLLIPIVIIIGVILFFIEK